MEKGSYGPVIEVASNGSKYIVTNHQTEEVISTSEAGRVILIVGEWLYNR